MRLGCRPEHDRRKRQGESGSKPTALIIDEDLGFTFWLGQALDSIGWMAVPAQNTTDADELVGLHGLQIDVLVIDPFIPDAFAFVVSLRKAQPWLQVVAAIPEAWEKPWPSIPEFNAAIRKPLQFTPEARTEWVDLIQRVLSTAWSELGGGDTVEN